MATKIIGAMSFSKDADLSIMQDNYKELLYVMHCRKGTHAKRHVQKHRNLNKSPFCILDIDSVRSD
jgi:hypothetical protein